MIRYYVQKFSRTHGGIIVLWRKNKHGYTRDLDEALKVTEEEAKELNLGEDSVLRECGTLEALSRRMVDEQELKYGRDDIPM